MESFHLFLSETMESFHLLFSEAMENKKKKAMECEK